jgi:hypothetical protein
MKFDDLPSVSRMRDEINKLRQFLKFNASTGGRLVPTPQALEFASKVEELKTQLAAQVLLFETFDKNFSSSGWIVHDLMNVPMMQRANDAFLSDGIEQAEPIVLEQYGPANIERMLPFLLAVPELAKRERFIRQAFEDYRNDRLMSCIPILLMMIDGAVNDFVGRGMHSDDIELDAWDSIAAANDGVSRMHRIFITGRRKTHEEQISLPYRNGILHGMDLGYDNSKVAAKCWHYLFVIRDWMHAKRTEDDRLAKHEKESHPPELNEVLPKLERTERVKAIIAEWRPRTSLREYVLSLQTGASPSPSSAEATAIEYLGLWKARNYGYMERLTWNVLTSGSAYVEHIKQTFRDESLLSYRILQIRDEAPIIAEVDLETQLADGRKDIWTIRLTYVRDDGDLTVPQIGDGAWRVVSCHRKQAT